MSIIRRAKRENIPLKIGLRAPSGAGKTYSSILLAKGLMGGDLEKVCLIDTENGSGDLYSHLGNYAVLPFSAPFKPQRYVNAIELAVKEGFKCIIIDSTSHEWDGPGGCLDIHSSIPGNSFIAWKQVTPMHDAFIKAILQAPVHVICCMRTKQDYSMEKNEQGKLEVRKMGLKEIQRDGFEYELTISFNIEINHMATASKDRSGLFKDNVPFLISEETGKQILDWNNNG